MRRKILIISITIMLALSFSACQGLEDKDSDTAGDTVMEQSEETNEDVDAVAPEFDENGNPTGEYAQYIWEQEQKQEAMDSLARDAQVQQDYEDDKEWLGNPW